MGCALCCVQWRMVVRHSLSGKSRKGKKNAPEGKPQARRDRPEVGTVSDSGTARRQDRRGADGHEERAVSADTTEGSDVWHAGSHKAQEVVAGDSRPHPARILLSGHLRRRGRGSIRFKIRTSTLSGHSEHLPTGSDIKGLLRRLGLCLHIPRLPLHRHEKSNLDVRG